MSWFYPERDCISSHLKKNRKLGAHLKTGDQSTREKNGRKYLSNWSCPISSACGPRTTQSLNKKTEIRFIGLQQLYDHIRRSSVGNSKYDISWFTWVTNASVILNKSNELSDNKHRTNWYYEKEAV